MPPDYPQNHVDDPILSQSMTATVMGVGKHVSSRKLDLEPRRSKQGSPGASVKGHIGRTVSYCVRGKLEVLGRSATRQTSAHCPAASRR